MKNTLWTLVLLTAVSTVSQAQNWAPILPGEKYHYQTAGSGLIDHTLFVDSVYPIGSGDLYFLNRIIAPCDTCVAADYGLDEWACLGDSCIYLKNEPQFLQRQVVHQVGGIWIFSDPGYFELRPRASLGETWSYDGIETAEVTAIYEAELLGVMDSLKLIDITNGMSYVLSKEHGLVSCTDTDESSELVGLQSADLGMTMPDFYDVFDFEVGDIFEYKYSSYGSNGIVHRHYNQEIIEYEQFIDSIRLVYQKYGVFTYNGNSSLHNSTHEEILLREDFDFFNQNLNTLRKISSISNPQWNDQEYRLKMYPDNNRLILDFGIFLNQEIEDPFSIQPAGYVYFPIDTNPDIFFKYPLRSSLSDSYGWSMSETSRSYGVGIGLVTDYHFESLAYEALWNVGYIKSGDTTGTITPDSIFISTAANSLFEYDFKRLEIFPNPSNGLLQIQIPRSDTYTLQVIDPLGRVVLSESKTIEQGAYELDGSAWKSGIYTLHLTAEQTEWVGKFVVN